MPGVELPPVEERAYGEDSTPAEVAAIRARIYLHRPSVIMYVEMPVQSAFHIGVFDERLRELSSSLPSFDLLIDLTAAKPPGAETREALKRLFAARLTGVRRAAAFTGRNFMLNVAAKFVLGSFGLRDFSVHGTLAAAEAALARE
jgi:hypothetical protein